MKEFISFVGVDMDHAMSSEQEAKASINRPIPVRTPAMPQAARSVLDASGGGKGSPAPSATTAKQTAPPANATPPPSPSPSTPRLRPADSHRGRRTERHRRRAARRWPPSPPPLVEIAFRDAGIRASDWPWVPLLGGEDGYDQALIDHRGVLENFKYHNMH